MAASFFNMSRLIDASLAWRPFLCWKFTIRRCVAGLCDQPRSEAFRNEIKRAAIFQTAPELRAVRNRHGPGRRQDVRYP